VPTDGKSRDRFFCKFCCKFSCIANSDIAVCRKSRALGKLGRSGNRFMQQSPISSVPGNRVTRYRNSQPRFVRLYGLGESGGKIARDIGGWAGPNVAVQSGNRAVGWREIAGDEADPETNMIVVVCEEGDHVLFNADHNKPKSLVTFVLLQKVSNALVVADENFAKARNRCDLFVTTSDADYVGDLISNLAS
jgi:hypothetical protein